MQHNCIDNKLSTKLCRCGADKRLNLTRLNFLEFFQEKIFKNFGIFYLKQLISKKNNYPKLKIMTINNINDVRTAKKHSILNYYPFWSCNLSLDKILMKSVETNQISIEL